MRQEVKRERYTQTHTPTFCKCSTVLLNRDRDRYGHTKNDSHHGDPIYEKGKESSPWSNNTKHNSRTGQVKHTRDGSELKSGVKRHVEKSGAWKISAFSALAHMKE